MINLDTVSMHFTQQYDLLIFTQNKLFHTFTIIQEKEYKCKKILYMDIMR